MNFKSRKTAKLVVAATILVSSLASGYIQLNQFQGQVNKAYYQADGVNEYLTNKVQVADNLVVIASRNEVSSEAVSRAIVNLNGAKIKQAKELSAQLDEAFNEMIAALEQAPLNATDYAYLDKLSTDFTAAQDRLERSDYFANEAKVKEDISKFPASLISKLMGFNLETY